MARSVADAAALLTALAGADERTPRPREPTARRTTRRSSTRRFRGARIGVARNLAGFNDRVDRLLEDALAAMRDLGAEIVDPADIPHVDELEDPELEVLLFEFPADLESYLGSLGPCPAAPDARRPDRVQHRARGRRDAVLRAGAVRAGGGEGSAHRSPRTSEALETCHRLSRAEGIDAVMDQHRLDALVAPSNAPAWRIDHANGDHDVGELDAGGGGGLSERHVPMGFAFDLRSGSRSWAGPGAKGR
jgi:amidase